MQRPAGSFGEKKGILGRAGAVGDWETDRAEENRLVERVERSLDRVFIKPGLIPARRDRSLSIDR